MFEKLDDQEFVDLIFTSEDRLDLRYVEEAKQRAKVVVPLLCKVLQQERNYTAAVPAWWGVIHATYLLGILGEERALEALLAAGRFSKAYDIDWIWEALPEAYLRLGPSIVPRLKEYVAGHAKEWDDVTIESDGLWNFWEAHPERREDIEGFFLGLLEGEENDPTLNASVIADFALAGRRDLKPLFDEKFDRGEVDLDVFTRDNLEAFLEDQKSTPGYRKDLEGFYSTEAIEERQERWKEEDENAERRSLEQFLIEHHNRIGRNEKCPCGSGKKFKKCHLPWVEDELMRIRDEQERKEVLWQNLGAVRAERRAETEIRRLLASKGRTELFPLIRKQVIAFVTAQDEEVQARGFSGFFQQVLALLEFEGKEEVEQFMGSFQEYVNAVAHQYHGHPRGGAPTQ